jgi:hypothetical protein
MKRTTLLPPIVILALFLFSIHRGYAQSEPRFDDGSQNGDMTWKHGARLQLPMSTIQQPPTLLWEQSYNVITSHDSGSIVTNVLCELNSGGFYFNCLSWFGCWNVITNSEGDEIHRTSFPRSNEGAEIRSVSVNESGEIETKGLFLGSGLYSMSSANCLYYSTLDQMGVVLKEEYSIDSGYRSSFLGSYLLLSNNKGTYFAGLGQANTDKSLSQAGTVCLMGADRKVVWSKKLLPKNGIINEWVYASTEDEGGTVTSISTVDYDYYQSRRMRIIRTDLEGNILFTHDIKDSSRLLFARNIFPSGDGNYIVIANQFQKAKKDTVYCWVAKVNEYGDILWSRSYGGQNTWNNVNGAKQMKDGSYVIVGEVGDKDAYYSSGDRSSFDCYFLHINKDGDALQEYVWGKPDQLDLLVNLCETKDGNMGVIGYTGGNIDMHGGKIYVAKLKIQSSGVNTASSNLQSSLYLYPNPSVSGQVTIKSDADIINATYEVRDILGRVVMTEKQTGEETTLNTSALPAGSYLVSVKGSAASPTPLVIH